MEAKILARINLEIEELKFNIKETNNMLEVTCDKPFWEQKNHDNFVKIAVLEKLKNYIKGVVE